MGRKKRAFTSRQKPPEQAAFPRRVPHYLQDPTWDWKPGIVEPTHEEIAEATGKPKGMPMPPDERRSSNVIIRPEPQPKKDGVLLIPAIIGVGKSNKNGDSFWFPEDLKQNFVPGEEAFVREYQTVAPDPPDGPIEAPTMGCNVPAETCPICAESDYLVKLKELTLEHIDKDTLKLLEAAKEACPTLHDCLSVPLTKENAEKIKAHLQQIGQMEQIRLLAMRNPPKISGNVKGWSFHETVGIMQPHSSGIHPNPTKSYTRRVRVSKKGAEILTPRPSPPLEGWDGWPLGEPEE